VRRVSGPLCGARTLGPDSPRELFGPSTRRMRSSDENRGLLFGPDSPSRWGLETASRLTTCIAGGCEATDGDGPQLHRQGCRCHGVGRYWPWSSAAISAAFSSTMSMKRRKCCLMCSTACGMRSSKVACWSAVRSDRHRRGRGGGCRAMSAACCRATPRARRGSRIARPKQPGPPRWRASPAHPRCYRRQQPLR